MPVHQMTHTEYISALATMFSSVFNDETVCLIIMICFLKAGGLSESTLFRNANVYIESCNCLIMVLLLVDSTNTYINTNYIINN